MHSKSHNLSKKKRLAIVATHPIQYSTPLYAELSRRPELEVVVFFATDFGVTSQTDPEFGLAFAWDISLLTGFEYKILRQYGEDIKTGVAPTSVATNVASQLRTGQFDAVLINGYFAKIDREAIVAALIHRIPILFRPDGNDERESKSVIRNALRYTALTLLYTLISRYLSVGKISTTHYLNHFGRRSKVVLVPYSVDTKYFIKAREALLPKVDLRQSMGISNHEPVILYCGKLIEKKNCEMLPKILRSLLSKSFAVTMVIVGAGPLMNSLKLEFEAITNSKVLFSGFQNQSQIAKYYAIADLLILPSQFGETWGLVVNEALALGLPAVVSDRVGCRHDLIVPGETGAVFESNNVENAVQSIIQLFANKDAFAEMSKFCKELSSKYSLEKSADGIVTALS